MKVPTVRQADKNTKLAIRRTKKSIDKLMNERNKYPKGSSQRKDIDQQIAQNTAAISRLQNSLG
jgi:hypothetical protein